MDVHDAIHRRRSIERFGPDPVAQPRREDARGGDAPHGARPVSGIILAGGKARRLGGRDKAFILVEGRTIFDRIRSVLEPRVSEIVVVTPRPALYPADVRTADDRLPGCGPLGGLHAGLHAARCEHALVVACDMPFLSPALLDHMLALVGDEDAVVPVWEGRLQTLHAVYARRLAEPAGRALWAGVRALHEFLATVRTRAIEEGEIASIEGARESFRNINTPDEMDARP